MGDPEAGTVPPWAVFVPRDTTSVDLRAGRLARCRRALADLPDGAWVSLLDHHRLSHWRLRRVARKAGLVVERELVVVPGAGATVVVEDAAHDAGIGLLRWAWTRWWAAERVVLARRT